jgi:Fe2+ transport system protein FeoA
VFDAVPLNFLRSGQCGTIDQVLGQPADVQRMEELGLRAGANIEVVCSGTPCIIQLAGQRLCFRASDFIRVMVRPGVAV